MLALATVDQQQSWTEIELAGVVPAEQGRGRYGHLLAAVEDASTSKRLVISTQGHNTGVQRAWARYGFEPVHTLLTVHLVTPGLLPMNVSWADAESDGCVWRGTAGASMTGEGSLVAARTLVAPVRRPGSIGSGGCADQDVDRPPTEPRRYAVVTPRLSVVVPFYNVGEYIGDCLDSIARQTWTDFEAILVDDGSPDDSAAIAKEFCAGDSRFRIVEQENQGLGPARNTGVRHADGEYITFVDSDDLVTRHGFEKLIRTLDETGSSFAGGNARRFNNSAGVRPSWIHRLPFAQDRIATHVIETPDLILDRMVWNKVYRRSFWDEYGYEFPAIRYEDYPVTLKAHLDAVTVDALAVPVYYWRERESGESITQQKFQFGNLEDRVRSAEMVMDLIERPAVPRGPAPGARALHPDRHADADDGVRLGPGRGGAEPGQAGPPADGPAGRLGPGSRAQLRPAAALGAARPATSTCSAGWPSSATTAACAAAPARCRGPAGRGSSSTTTRACTSRTPFGAARPLPSCR